MDFKIGGLQPYGTVEFPAETATMQVARVGGCIILQPWEEKNEDRKRFKVCL